MEKTRSCVEEEASALRTQNIVMQRDLTHVDTENIESSAHLRDFLYLIFLKRLHSRIFFIEKSSSMPAC